MARNKRPPKTPRASAAEIAQRVDFVFKLIRDGASTKQVIDKVKADHPEWKVDARQIQRYIAAANEEFIAASQYVRAFEVGRSLYRLDDLYSKTLKVQDYQRALAANAQRAQITGINAPTQTNVTLHLFNEAGVTIELVTALLDAFKSRGISASEVFNSILAELAQEDVKP